jgi:hypothetical protein
LLLKLLPNKRDHICGETLEVFFLHFKSTKLRTIHQQHIKMHEADPTSQSNYLQIATKHITFDWIVDFDNKIITGTATHDFIAKVDEVSEVM